MAQRLHTASTFLAAPRLYTARKTTEKDVAQTKNQKNTLYEWSPGPQYPPVADDRFISRRRAVNMQGYIYRDSSAQLTPKRAGNASTRLEHFS